MQRFPNRCIDYLLAFSTVSSRRGTLDVVGPSTTKTKTMKLTRLMTVNKWLMHVRSVCRGGREVQVTGAVGRLVYPSAFFSLQCTCFHCLVHIGYDGCRADELAMTSHKPWYIFEAARSTDSIRLRCFTL